MLAGIITVLGFMAVIFMFFFTLLHFLGKELHPHDAEHVDSHVGAHPKHKY